MTERDIYATGKRQVARERKREPDRFPCFFSSAISLCWSHPEEPKNPL